MMDMETKDGTVAGTKRAREELAEEPDDFDDADNSRRRRKHSGQPAPQTGPSTVMATGDKSLRDFGALSDRNENNNGSRYSQRGGPRYRGRGRGGGYRRGGGRRAAPLGPEARIRAMLVKVGDNQLDLSLDATKNFLGQVSSLEMVLGNDLASFGTLIRNTIVECAASFPHKTVIYSSLATLLAKKQPSFGDELVQASLAKFNAALKLGNWNRCRLLFRFLGTLAVLDMVEQNSFVNLVQQGYELAHKTVSENAFGANKLFYTIIAIAPWLSSKLHDAVFTADTKAKLGDYVLKHCTSEDLESHSSIMKMWQLISSVGVDQTVMSASTVTIAAEEKGEPSSISVNEENGKQVETSSQETSKEVLSCDVTLVSSALEHFRDTIFADPPAVASTEMEDDESDEKVAQKFVQIQNFQFEALPAEQDNVKDKLVPKSGDLTTTQHGYDNISCILVREMVTDILQTYFPMQVDIVKTFSGLPSHGGAHKPSLFAFDVVVSEMLRPQPNKPLPFYHGLLVKLCKSLPTEVPIAIEDTMDALFKKAVSEDFPIYIADRMCDWFAVHLISFGLAWPWSKWESFATKSHEDVEFMLVEQVIQRTERLSFFERVRDVLPEKWKHWFQEEKEKYPTSEYFSASGEAAEENPSKETEDNDLLSLGTEVVGLIKGKSSLATFTDFFDGEKCKVLSTASKLELLIHAALKVGSPSLTHHQKVLDIIIPVLVQFIGVAGVNNASALVISTECSEDEFEGHSKLVHSLMTSVAKYLPPSSSRFSFVVSKFLEAELIDIGAFLGWCIEHQNESFSHWWIWELLRRILNGAKAEENSCMEKVNRTKGDLQAIEERIATLNSKSNVSASKGDESMDLDAKEDGAMKTDDKEDEARESTEKPDDDEAKNEQGNADAEVTLVAGLEDQNEKLKLSLSETEELLAKSKARRSEYSEAIESLRLKVGEKAKGAAKAYVEAFPNVLAE